MERLKECYLCEKHVCIIKSFESMYFFKERNYINNYLLLKIIFKIKQK